jgi:probable rRNA maturation factor
MGGTEREDSEVPLPEGVIPHLERVLASKVVEILPEMERFPRVEASLVYVTEAEIQNLNAEYRDIERPTDVLSFPLWEEEGVFAPPSFKDMEEVVLGDIVVCPLVVRRQAQEAGVPVLRENLLVIIHGFLHLIGFDHAEENEKARMWKVQENILDQILTCLSEDGDGGKLC